MNKDYHIIGLMSGTSLDGVDIVKCVFNKGTKTKFVLEKSETFEYSNYWRKKLENLHLKGENEINACNIEYGEFLGKLCNEFISKNNLKTDYISSHGHTIFHQPENGYTLQIGCGNKIAEKTNITTINNFRELDVSLDGNGAPLVPIGDLHLFSEHKYCLNLGGFANISIKGKLIRAFDICPVNIILNYLSSKIGLIYDKNGCIARRGKLNYNLLNRLNMLDFYNKKNPKSLSREWVEKEMFPILNSIKSPVKDQLNTICEHIAIQISKNLKDESVLITGGGAHNTFLIERLHNYSNSRLIMPSNEIINFKEAIIFAYLGILRIENINNCLSSVTGAKYDNCGGDIYIK